MFGEYMPKTAILIWSVVLSCARFENQRWIRARMGGLQGSSAWFGLFIDATGLIALVFAVTIAALSLYDFGWRKTAGLLVLTLTWGLVLGRYWCVCRAGRWPASIMAHRYCARLRRCYYALFPVLLVWIVLMKAVQRSSRSIPLEPIRHLFRHIAHI
jgi:hypothetical protein